MKRHSELVKCTHIGSKTDPLSIGLPNTDMLFIVLYYRILFYYNLLFYYYPIRVCFQMKDREGSDGRGDKEDLG